MVMAGANFSVICVKWWTLKVHHMSKINKNSKLSIIYTRFELGLPNKFTKCNSYHLKAKRQKLSDLKVYYAVLMLILFVTTYANRNLAHKKHFDTMNRCIKGQSSDDYSRISWKNRKYIAKLTRNVHNFQA